MVCGFMCFRLVMQDCVCIVHVHMCEEGGGWEQYAKAVVKINWLDGYIGIRKTRHRFHPVSSVPNPRLFFFPSKSPSPLPLPFSLSGSKWSSCWASSGFREVRWPFPSSYSLPLPAPKVDTMDPLMALLCLLSLYSGRSMGERMWGSCGWGWCYPGWVSMGKTNSLLCFPLLVCAFLLFSISALCLHAHRLGCSCSLLPSERENLRRQFHPQPWLGSWECPHLLLSPGLLSITSVSAVLEQRTVADPKSHPVHKGSLQT